jgi:hypothetical protein
LLSTSLFTIGGWEDKQKSVSQKTCLNIFYLYTSGNRSKSCSHFGGFVSFVYSLILCIMTKINLLLLGFFCFTITRAQFAPQVGTAGTTAIHKDSSVFKAWATNCTLQLGWQNIADTTKGKAQVGDASYVPGKAGNGVVSLGDAGRAIVQFLHPIINGEGADFAVFENGFIDQTLAPGTAFLELAFVEVSSDGIHYTRFPSTCLNNTTAQLGSFEGIVAQKLNNFAGKYLGNYGTPFDLEELKDSVGLDVNHITHVKIIDVVGSIDSAYASYDANGNKVNDPWPTDFASSGFDLDAVGVINQDLTQGLQTFAGTQKLSAYPNPASTNQIVSIQNIPATAELTIFDLRGSKMNSYVLNQTENEISLQFEQAGCYNVLVKTDVGVFQQRIIVQ